MKSLMARSSNRAPAGPACGRPADELDLAARGRRGHAVDPEHELALAVELAVDVGGAPRDAGVVDAGQARLQRQVLGREQPALDVELASGRDGAADQAHRAVDEDAGRLPVLVADDLAVGRGLRVLRDLGPPHRLGVGPAGVAVDPLEPDRPVRGHRVEHRRGRERAARPEALVPVPAGDPRVAGRRVDPRLDPPGDLLERRDPAQVDLFLAGAERLHVAVGVDQAGDREGVGPVDHAGRRAAEAHDLRRRCRRRRSRRRGRPGPRPRGGRGRRSRSAPP